MQITFFSRKNVFFSQQGSISINSHRAGLAEERARAGEDGADGGGEPAERQSPLWRCGGRKDAGAAGTLRWWVERPSMSIF